MLLPPNNTKIRFTRSDSLTVVDIQLKNRVTAYILVDGIVRLLALSVLGCFDEYCEVQSGVKYLLVPCKFLNKSLPGSCCGSMMLSQRDKLQNVLICLFCYD